jgi:histidine triad (HIT) family protein
MGEDCIMCQAVSDRIPTFKIYEDEKAAAFLSERAASVGHVIIVPKQHFPILEGTPDYIAGHLLVVANKISMALFEAFGAQGTNIIIQNGVAAGQDTPHLMVHVIARLPDDRLNFQWQTRQLSEEQMSTIELSIKDRAKSIGNFEKEKPKPVNLDSMGKTEVKRAPDKEEKKEEAPEEEKKEPSKKDDAEEDDSKEENYLIKQLRRMP